MRGNYHQEQREYLRTLRAKRRKRLGISEKQHEEWIAERIRLVRGY